MVVGVILTVLCLFSGAQTVFLCMIWRARTQQETAEPVAAEPVAAEPVAAEPVAAEPVAAAVPLCRVFDASGAHRFSRRPGHPDLSSPLLARAGWRVEGDHTA